MPLMSLVISTSFIRVTHGIKTDHLDHMGSSMYKKHVKLNPTHSPPLNISFVLIMHIVIQNKHSYL